MSNFRQTLRDLVAAYDCKLEQQIVGQGTNLACRDQDFVNQVEAILKDGITEETHCLHLDPLRVMEESIMDTAAVPGPSVGQVKARGGLQGLAKAFEVLEQAALNLYLSPWREEYKVVKMYSGMFTHYIKPVLSKSQIERVFGLLGYKPSFSGQEQLNLQSSRTNPSYLDDLLRLSCAFFLARCECCLLVTALGNHVGEAEWELSMVKERQRGHSIQDALESTKKTLKVNQPVIESSDADVDLYTDEQSNEGQNEVCGVNDEGPHSLTWVTESSTSPTAVKNLSNGIMSLPTPSASLSTGEHTCISTLNCQLTKTSPGESDVRRISSTSKKPSRQLCEVSAFDSGNQPQSHSLQLEAMGLDMRESEANQICSCPHCCYPYPTTLQLCVECKMKHNFTCAFLENCKVEQHNLVTLDSTDVLTMNRSGSLSAQSESLKSSDMMAVQTFTGNNTVMSSLDLCDTNNPIIHKPISYHDCCHLGQLDPRVLCLSCCVFHSHPCREQDYCQIHHTVKKLGVCECGKLCSRNPLVLCRYCGKEYCNACWYRSPVICTCGQTFDQSSSV